MGARERHRGHGRRAARRAGRRSWCSARRATVSRRSGVMRGVAEAAGATGCPVVGGDLSAGRRAGGRRHGDRCSVASRPAGAPERGGAGGRVCSSPARSVARRRACALLRATARARTAPASARPTAGPSPGSREGEAAEAAGAHAMIDVSDGLALDLHRLADASGVGFRLDDVPVADGATLDEALGGGEDYELVFTVARRAADGLVEAFDAAGLRPPMRDRRVVGGPGGADASTGRAARAGSAGSTASGERPGLGVAQLAAVRRGRRRGLGDLAGPDARRADVQPLGGAVDQRPHPLDVGVPAPLGAPVGVADVHAERRPLAADVAHRCHGGNLPEVADRRRRPRRPSRTA